MSQLSGFGDKIMNTSNTGNNNSTLSLARNKDLLNTSDKLYNMLTEVYLAEDSYNDNIKPDYNVAGEECVKIQDAIRVLTGAIIDVRMRISREGAAIDSGIVFKCLAANR